MGKDKKHKKRVEWRFLSGQRMFSNQDAPLSIQSWFRGRDIDPSPHSVSPLAQPCRSSVIAMALTYGCLGRHMRVSYLSPHACVSEGDTEFPFRVDMVSMRTARMEARTRG